MAEEIKETVAKKATSTTKKSTTSTTAKKTTTTKKTSSTSSTAKKVAEKEVKVEEAVVAEAPQKKAAPKAKKAPKARVFGNRLQEKYFTEVAPALNAKFGYKSVMQIPAINKVVINIGVGEATSNSKALDDSVRELMQITGQKPVVTRAKQ